MNLVSFNQLDKEKAAELLLTCCGSARWVTLMMEKFPFDNEQILVSTAEQIWYEQTNAADWLDAFSHHPKIGDIKSLAEKFAATQHLTGNEQAGVQSASQKLVEELAHANKEYEKKFGFIFIVCATGKTAAAMLRLLLDRIINNKEEELSVAMGEQHKITLLRLKKIITAGDWQWLKISQLTTHVLDTSIGKPGENISIRLKKVSGNNWQTITQGITDADGRIADLLPPNKKLAPGNYKIVFETAAYFFKNNVTGFYPEVEIQFTVFDDAHYHVPLLINPFGYSTYRGS